jgi:hypothetical protein
MVFVNQRSLITGGGPSCLITAMRSKPEEEHLWKVFGKLMGPMGVPRDDSSDYLSIPWEV